MDHEEVDVTIERLGDCYQMTTIIVATHRTVESMRAALAAQSFDHGVLFGPPYPHPSCELPNTESLLGAFDRAMAPTVRLLREVTP